MIIVLDASALITLAKIGQLDLLRKLAEYVFVPEAVYNEVVINGQGRPGSLDVSRAQWISRHQIQDQAAVARLRTRLGQGESEAIVLARETRADTLVLDDATARRIAEADGQHVVGLLGLLINAKERGAINSVKSIIDDMISAGFFVDPSLYRTILQLAAEER